MEDFCYNLRFLLKMYNFVLGEGVVHPGERAGDEDQPRPRGPHPLSRPPPQGPRKDYTSRGYAGLHFRFIYNYRNYLI